MADKKDSKPDTSAQAQQSQAAAAGGQAAASGDPAVHKLLADKATAQRNRDDAAGPTDPEAVQRWDEEIARIDKELGDLGYSR